MTASLAVLQGSPDATLVLDGAGRIVFANGRARRLFGAASPAALAGRSFEELVTVDCRRWLRDALTIFFAAPPASSSISAALARLQPAPIWKKATSRRRFR
jgi:PAS domain-containing protein